MIIGESMSSPSSRAYSRYTLEALRLFGKEIELARKAKKITAEALSEKCGVSRATLRKIERGEATTEIGIAFEAAAVVGIRLFGSENAQSLREAFSRSGDKAALLPQRVRLKGTKVDDAF